MESNEKKRGEEQPPVKMPETISQFAVHGKAPELWYALWIRIDFKKSSETKWHRSDRGPTVNVGETDILDLRKVPGLEDGMDVRLNIEVKLGSDKVRAQQYFTYENSSKLEAFYYASGTTFDASVIFQKVQYRTSK